MTPRDPLLLEIAVALGAGRVTLGPIHCDGELIHGYKIERGRRRGFVHLNPNVELVDTAIHELMHRMRPAWAEGTVRRRTAKIMRSLSDAEIDKLYELIHVTAKVRKRPVNVECD